MNGRHGSRSLESAIIGRPHGTMCRPELSVKTTLARHSATIEAVSVGAEIYGQQEKPK
jgi:hypothetical protein